DHPITTFLDPCPDVASNRNDLEIGTKQLDLKCAAKRGGADRTARFDLREGPTVERHHGVSGVLPGRDTAQRKPWMQEGRDILERVNYEGRLTLDQQPLDPIHEELVPADLGEWTILDLVSGRHHVELLEDDARIQGVEGP